MTKARTVFLAAVVGLVSLALLVSVTPVIATSHTTHAQEASQAKSITGKIRSVEKNSFTLSVGTAINNEGTGQQTNEKTMTFAIDRNTTIEGKLQVGGTADVTYRESNGSYVAISVHVQPNIELFWRGV